MISKKEKKARQHKKELKSFRNKMGSHKIWFDSLPLGKQYDLLFLWKTDKHYNKLEKPLKSFSRRTRKVHTVYPINFKYFILPYRINWRFQPTITNLRNTTIDLILGKE